MTILIESAQMQTIFFTCTYYPNIDLQSMNCPTLVPMKCRGIMVHNRLLQSGSSKRWNDLPKAVKSAGSLTLFKKQPKVTFSVSNNIPTNCITYVHVLVYVLYVFMYLFTVQSDN